MHRPSLLLPPLQRFTLSNGLRVVLLEKHGVPLVDLVLQINAGSVMDPRGKSGLAGLTFAMLDEGTVQRNALQIADEIDYLGASLSIRTGWHKAHIKLHTPVARLAPALALMAEVALQPTFPADEVERQRKLRLTSLVQAHDEPDVIADATLKRVLFGEHHPYGGMAGGDEKSLRSLTVQDCRAFYQRFMVPDNATLIVVGDVDPATLRPQLETVFGKWQGRRAADGGPAWPAVKQVEQCQIYLVDKPGAAQSAIRLGRIGPTRFTEDYYALTVLNTILGGSFTSRLNQNLREQHGYSYGAGSYFELRPQPAAFIAYADVQTEATDKAVTEFLKELRGMLAELPEEELSRARNYLALSYPGNFQTTGQIADELMEVVAYNLPDTYFNDYVQKILAVTRAEVEAAAKKYIDPEKTAIIIVGDRAKIAAGLQALRLGKINHLTIEQVLGKIPKLEAGD
ncbi:MAG: insulinase family protein [candidate division KSB1 bacterium]|nr:insulinase family protein [candidate division KSB1 bacterium]MDZ7275499.1 insulinase family protein [candidate division KSB1 bacterium]MDZ7286189.1 insulinase family protein [candidate division KSB1 bacterium]MDZ7296415.1 insulinase family protein [candidate division KSB1 bacterium]MDZ7308945.1 insulinase family protein [candidate division KSB1 bacterium]